MSKSRDRIMFAVKEFIPPYLSQTYAKLIPGVKCKTILISDRPIISNGFKILTP